MYKVAIALRYGERLACIGDTLGVISEDQLGGGLYAYSNRTYESEAFGIDGHGRAIVVLKSLGFGSSRSRDLNMHVCSENCIVLNIVSTSFETRRMGSTSLGRHSYYMKPY